MPMSFETWLRRQKHRDDWVGDLAVDYIATKSRKKLTYESLPLHACEGAYKALKQARSEWYNQMHEYEQKKLLASRKRKELKNVPRET